jgi:hypothetical protein
MLMSGIGAATPVNWVNFSMEGPLLPKMRLDFGGVVDSVPARRRQRVPARWQPQGADCGDRQTAVA